jgi:hypothetical protein
MKERRKDVSREKKFGWYFRYRHYGEMLNQPKFDLPIRIRMADLEMVEEKMLENGVETVEDIV